MPDDRHFPMAAQLAAIGSVTCWELTNELTMILSFADNAQRVLDELPMDHPARLALGSVKKSALQAASKLADVASFYYAKGVRPAASTIEATLRLLDPKKK